MSGNSLIKIDGQPLEKLIEVISNGVGTLYKPRAIRKEAEAKAYEIEILERAKSKALAEKNEIEAESLQRIQERIIHKELRRQKNIDNVSEIAVKQMEHEASVSEEPLNKDWTTRFFNIIEDVSDKDMQQLWGKILAGEVKKPGSYSLRTLEVLKNLSKEEAEVFTKFAHAKIQSMISNTFFIYNQEDSKYIESTFNITFQDRLLMTELGLIASEKNVQFYLASSTGKSKAELRYGNIVIEMNRNGEVPKQNISVLLFTKTGIELSNLILQDINEEYLYKLCESFSHPNVEIQYWESLNGQEIKKNVKKFTK